MEFLSPMQEIRVILSSRLSLFCISLSPDTSERYTSECFLVSVFDAVSGESLAELHHSGARTGATSSSLFFLAVAILARSSQVLRWRLDRLPRGFRENLGLTRSTPCDDDKERRCSKTPKANDPRAAAWTFVRELFYRRVRGWKRGERPKKRERGSVLRLTYCALT